MASTGPWMVVVNARSRLPSGRWYPSRSPTLSTFRFAGETANATIVVVPIAVVVVVAGVPGDAGGGLFEQPAAASSAAHTGPAALTSKFEGRRSLAMIRSTLRFYPLARLPHNPGRKARG